MNWLLKRSLRKLAETADPRPVFVRDLHRELVGSTTAWSDLRTLGWKVPAVGVTMFSMAVSATGVYAYSSDAVLPDHPLYSVRQEIERVEEKVAVSPTAKVAVQVKHLQRRLHEHELLTLKMRKTVQEPMPEFESSVQRVLDDSKELPEPARANMNAAITKIQHSRKVFSEKEKERLEKIDKPEKNRERKENKEEND